MGLAQRVSERVRTVRKRLKIAVMGCVVNGPGEAQRCDFGVAGGKDKSAIFVKGQVVKTVNNEDLIKEILAFIDKL